MASQENKSLERNNPYMAILSSASAKGSLEERYTREKEKLENNLGFAVAGDISDNLEAERIKYKIRQLEFAYDYVTEEGRNKKTVNYVNNFFAIILFVIAAFLMYDNHKKKQIIQAQDVIINQKMAEISSTSAKFNSEISEMKAGKDKLQGLLDAEKALRSAAETANKTLKDEKTKMADDMIGLNTEIETLKKDNQTLSASNEELKTKNKTISDENSSLQKTKEQLEKNNKDLSASNELMKNNMAAMETDSAARKKEIQALETKNKSANEEIKKLTAEKEKLSKSNSQLSKDIAELRKKCPNKQ